LLKEGPDPEEARELINISEQASKGLIEEIMLQRQIKAAENGDLNVNIEPIRTMSALESAVNKIRFHDVAKDKTVVIHKKSVDCMLETDKILLQRILINLIKNALEATQAGGKVTIGALDKTDEVKFWVKNEFIIPREIQLQIFQRSFSTKEAGRGIGTYSIRLLTENYLKGNVSFVSNEEEGTIFELAFSKRFQGPVPRG
jgi:signal transduction histidine kinase